MNLCNNILGAESPATGGFSLVEDANDAAFGMNYVSGQGLHTPINCPFVYHFGTYNWPAFAWQFGFDTFNSDANQLWYRIKKYSQWYPWVQLHS